MTTNIQYFNKINSTISKNRYDYIIHLEHINEELPVAYKAITGQNLPRDPPFPKYKYSDKKKWEDLSSVPFPVIEKTLTRLYSIDYNAFSYSMLTKSEYLQKTRLALLSKNGRQNYTNATNSTR